jgi:hypothetical protein
MVLPAVGGWLAPSSHDERLGDTPEGAGAVGEAAAGDRRAVRPDPRLGGQEDPVADRLAREADREVAVGEGPVGRVQRRRTIEAAWTRRPCRVTSARMMSGATGTGRTRSSVSRATRIGTGAARRSAAQATIR